MPRIPKHIIEEIRLRTDLVAVVERHVKLKQRGTSHVGLCPFHQEKSPSFNVVPHKHLYYCFGCQAGGDCFRFLMEIEGLTFGEAVRELAEQAGIPVEERELSPAERARIQQRTSLYDVLDKASRFWEQILMTRPEGAAARAYLHGRGIDEDTARAWRLGFAPDLWTATIDRLQREHLDADLLLAAGIARRSQKTGNLYDAFRGRITVPITDERGRIIAFGARLLEGDGPKYINSTDGDLYQKSKVLFGMHHARQAIQRTGRALVVEGYFDVISLHQAGFAETIATCGTALTADHLESLRRLTGSVITLFDSDAAGARAAEKTLPMFYGAGIDPWRLELPDAKDPDELIQSEGPDAMRAALERPVPLLDWVVDRRMAAAGGSSASESLIREIVPLLAMTEGTDLVTRAAARLRVHVPVLRARVEEARRQGPATAPRPTPTGAPPDDENTTAAARWRPSRDQVHVLWLMIHRLTEVADLATRLELPEWPELDVARPVARALLDGEPVASILDRCEEPGLRHTLSVITARTTLYTPAQAERGLAHLAHRFLLARVDRQLGILSDRVQRAVAQNAWDVQRESTRAQLDLRHMRNDLERTFKAGDTLQWATDASGLIAALDEPTHDDGLSPALTKG